MLDEDKLAVVLMESAGAATRAGLVSGTSNWAYFMVRKLRDYHESIKEKDPGDGDGAGSNGETGQAIVASQNAPSSQTGQRSGGRPHGSSRII